jgi:hypothetical protein
LGTTPNAQGTPPLDFITELILLEVERGRFADALSQIGRYETVYGSNEIGQLFAIREYVRFRSGETYKIPQWNDQASSTPFHTWLTLELRNAARKSHAPAEDAMAILRDIDRELAAGNRERGGLLSLRAILLWDLGRRAEALTDAQRAVTIAAEARKTRVYARLQWQIADERLKEISRKNR